MAETMANFAGQAGGDAGGGSSLVAAANSGGLEGASPGIVPDMVRALALFDPNGQPVDLLGTGVNVLGDSPTADENLKRGVLASGKS
ncbi:hypothetical protein CCP4SC76_3510003 [Gammaproteobacteria bacterium]